MNPLEGLAQYLDRLEKRLRWFTWTRGAAAIVGAALVLTLAAVGGLAIAAFSPSSVLLGRFVLFLGVGAAIALGLVIPLLKMNQARAAKEVEQRHPGFDQRLLTFTERRRDNAQDPFLPLLAEDALSIARTAQPEEVIEGRKIFSFASAAAASAFVLLWLMFFGPGVMGYGTALLWGSLPKDHARTFFSVTVEPGSRTIRRRTDVAVTAHLSGFSSSKASVFAKYASSAKWEEAPMQPENSGFSFMFVGVPEDVEYYVESNGVRSSTYKLHTVDLPSVKNIKVTYNYPAWTGMKSVTEDPGGDLRAVEGTVAKLEITTDRALSGAQILIDDAAPIDLPSTKDNVTTANVTISKDGTYHIGVTDHGDPVRLSDDYFIEARKVNPPKVRIDQPGRDAKVSPIEEVRIEITGESEFPLQDLSLHYSVNAGTEKTVALTKQANGKEFHASTMLSMEDYKLVPGDIVSFYATTKDGKNSNQTDMFFIQAVPFEFNYSQSQQMGGGGGGGGDQQDDQQISERQKEIIAATFNQIKGGAKAQATAAENGKYLSEVQSKLRDQAQSLANRTKARQLDGSGAAFQVFVKEMEAAVAAMTPSSDKLKALQFQDALTPEQQALQHLLRAESTFRDIQIQMSRGGGGGGGGGGGAGRDLANLFDLELDKDKNNYETNASAAAEQKQQQIDDALKKLEELARRQQQLAQQQQNNPQQMAQQRYQQEMLRREAEQLKREMEQLQRGDQSQQQQSQNGQQQQGQQSSSGQQSQSGQSGQSGQQQSGQQSARQQQQNGQQQNGQQQQQQGQQQQQAMTRPQGRQQFGQEQLERAIKQLEDATREMSQAASARQQGQPGANAQSEAQKAAERLQQAEQTIQSLRKQQNTTELSDLAMQSAELAEKQADFEMRLRQQFSKGGADAQTQRKMADEKGQMLDQYEQLQKDMQQATRNLAGNQPDMAKRLRDAMGKSQQDEVQTKMQTVQRYLRGGMGQYAVMQEAPVTRSLNELKDTLRKLQADSAGRQEGNGPGDDRTKQAMQQALDQAERVRREIEQLARAQQAARDAKNGQQGQNGRNGQQQANGQQGGQQQGQQSGRNGNQQGQQGQQGQQQAMNGQQGGQQSGGQQQGGQQGGQQSGGQQQGGQQGGQQAGMQRGGAQQGGGNLGGGNAAGGNIYGGNNYGVPNYPGANDPRAYDARNGRQQAPTPAETEQMYNDLQRDLNRLRGQIANDKDLAREYGDLQRQIQQLDPKHLGDAAQLDSIIGQQSMSGIDQIELLLRKKLQNDGAVHSTNPRNTPPGYADAVAEYYKKLSRQ